MIFMSFLLGVGSLGLGLPTPIRIISPTKAIMLAPVVHEEERFIELPTNKTLIEEEEDVVPYKPPTPFLAD